MQRRRDAVPPEVEAAIASAIADLPSAVAAHVLASIANRAAAALHKLAREVAESKRGTPEWGRWARLQNASRDAVLRTASCREVAGELAGPDTEIA